MRFRMKTLAAVGLAAAVVALGLTGCSGDSSSTTTAKASELDAVLKKGGTITYWSWTPSGQAQVDAFEKAYPKVHVNFVNTTGAAAEYAKLQNVIKAGSGVPDVAQIEYYALPQFALPGDLSDLNAYGLGDLKGKYIASTWDSVQLQGKLYGLPQDSGAMALFYNKRIFDKYGLSVPTTWDEYIADAKKLHAANADEYITSDTGDAGQDTSLIWQAGGRPFSVSGTKVQVNLQDAGAKKWTSVWNQLVENKLLSSTAGWSDDWYRQLANGQIATLVAGAWMPGVLESGAKGGSGDWRVAPIPTYDGGAAVTSNNGGSTESVLKQSKNQALAAAFVRWLNSNDTSIKVFLQSGGFPATIADLNSSSFLNSKPAYFGGQAINKVLVAASGTVGSGWQYLPYQVYANTVFTDSVGQSYQSSSDLNAGLTAWQTAIVKYGNEQGFTVTGK